MYIDCLVKMLHAPGKIVCQKKGDTTYVYYEIDRTYDPEKKYTAPKRVTIGKHSKADLDMILPNENFLHFFPDESLPEEKDRSSRSSCLRIGSFIVIRQLMKESRISDFLKSLTIEQSTSFLNERNSTRDHRQKIYISYYFEKEKSLEVNIVEKTP